jgi:GTP cyclohydrolase III
MEKELEMEKRIIDSESGIKKLMKYITDCMSQQVENTENIKKIEEIILQSNKEIANKIIEIDSIDMETLKEELEDKLNRNLDEKERNVTINNLDLVDITRTITKTVLESVKKSIGNKEEDNEVKKSSIIKPIVFSTIISSMVSVLLFLGGNQIINLKNKGEKEETIKYDKNTKFNCLIKKTGTFTSFVFESTDEITGVKNIYGWENDKYICYYDLNN